MIEVLWKKTVVANETYNSWPNLLHYRGKYWLIFSAGAAHTAQNHRMLCMTSPDGEHWSESRVVADTHRNDVSGGSFVFDGKLYCMFVSTWPLPNDVDRRRVPSGHQTMVTWTEDGTSWSEPRPCCEEGWTIWRPKVYNDRIYGAFYRSYGVENPDLARSVLLSSTDGERWSYVSTILEGRSVNETEIEFFGDRLIAVLRRGSRNLPSVLAMSWPPYAAWVTEDLPFRSNGPCMGRVGEQFVLMAREVLAAPPNPCNVTAWLWDRDSFEKTMEIDQGLDVGYPALQPMPENPSASLLAYYRDGQIVVAALKES